MRFLNRLFKNIQKKHFPNIEANFYLVSAKFLNDYLCLACCDLDSKEIFLVEEKIEKIPQKEFQIRMISTFIHEFTHLEVGNDRYGDEGGHSINFVENYAKHLKNQFGYLEGIFLKEKWLDYNNNPIIAIEMIYQYGLLKKFNLEQEYENYFKEQNKKSLNEHIEELYKNMHHMNDQKRG